MRWQDRAMHYSASRGNNSTCMVFNL